MEFNSVCNHSRDKRMMYVLPDYRPNWTPLSPITITNQYSFGSTTEISSIFLSSSFVFKNLSNNLTSRSVF